MKTNKTAFRLQAGDRQPRMARRKRNFCTELAETRKRDFEQEATDRTEIGKGRCLCPTSLEICRPLIRVMSLFESGLCALCFLLFKPVWLRFSLCALCPSSIAMLLRRVDILLWQSPPADVHYFVTFLCQCRSKRV